MPRKRNNGEGSITFDKSRNSYRAAITTPDGNRIFKRFKTEQEALIWKTDQLNSIHKGTFVAPSNITVGEWAIEWLTTYKKGIVAQSTYELYFYLATHLQTISEIKLQELTPVRVQKFYQELAAQTSLSAHTIHKVHKLLKDMIRKAFQLDMMQKNIMDNVSAPKFTKKDIEIFTRSEIEKILQTCHDHPKLKNRYPAILLAATTGMRLGEVLGLRWCDVNLTTSEIHIRKALTHTKALGLILGPLKTKSSIRKIKITPETADVLRQLKARTVNIDINQEKLCFVTRNDTPIGPRTFERSWDDILRLAGIPHKNIHVLRHTHATKLLAQDVPIVEVSRCLGHAKVGHTLELYGHAIPNYDDKIVIKIQELYVVPK